MEKQIEFDFELDAFRMEPTRKELSIQKDEDIELMARQNRIVLQMEELEGEYLSESSRLTKHLRIRCVAHPHPECRFKYVRLLVKFPEDKHVVVHDLIPQKVEGNEPLKIQSSFNGGLSFEYKEIKVSDVLAIDHSKEYQMYFPEVFGSGINTNRAIWDFKTPMDEAELHVNKDLFLLLSYPSTVSKLTTDIVLRADVQRNNWLGYVPIVGRKSETFEFQVEEN